LSGSEIRGSLQSFAKQVTRNRLSVSLAAAWDCCIISTTNLFVLLNLHSAIPVHMLALFERSTLEIVINVAFHTHTDRG